MNDPQADEILEQQDELLNQEGAEHPNEAGAGSDPAITPETEAVKFDEKQQKLVDDLIAKKVFRQKEAEREAERLRQQLAEVQARLPQQTRPEIPEIPDPLSLDESEYRKRMIERDDALRKAAAYDAQQAHNKAQQDQLKQQQEQQRQAALNERVQTYSTRAVKLGIKPEELQVAGTTVAQFGVSDDLVQYILDDDHGPLITQYLSRNLQDLEAISQLHPTTAAAYIATQIKPKAVALKPKMPGAPDPLDQPGTAAAPAKKLGLPNATYL